MPGRGISSRHMADDAQLSRVERIALKFGEFANEAEEFGELASIEVGQRIGQVFLYGRAQPTAGFHHRQNPTTYGPALASLGRIKFSAASA